VLYHTAGQDPDDTARLMAELEAANQVSRGILLPDGATDSGAVCQQVLGFVPSWVDTQTGLSLKVRQLMRDDFLVDHHGVDSVANLLASVDVRGKLQGRNAVHGALYLWAKTALPHYILSNLGDRMEMAHSVEGRVAFMDHHVAEYLHHVPGSLKIRGMTEKYILREAVKDVITDTVYRRQKHPFLSPPATLNPDQGLHALMQDTLRSAAVDKVPFLDRAKIVAKLDQAADGNQDFGTRVVTDQVLMVAMSYVFMHEGLGVAG
jgi:asparagine synthase (glutamine-hydrolysing)